MAADQRRKRSNGAAVADFSQPERSRNKKRHHGSVLENGLNMRSHISLEWDEKRKKVAAKKAQVGITWRELKPFVKSYPQGDRILADAFDIPQEIFQLENLDEVLSYEVWQSYLSESERKYLIQFLPAESDAQQIVKPLLAGDNFHFGNPFTKWSASLLSGNLHPDAVLHREKGLKDNKKAYYLELEKYHSDMIGYLLKLKERWENCKDPEEEFNQNIWRSRKNAGKNFFPPANGLRFDDVEDSVGATSESSSWAAEEKASTSDNQNKMIKGVKLQKRMGKKGPLDRSKKPSVASSHAFNVETKTKKGDKLRKRNIVYSDGAEYMSYVKISKKQHELAKSMEKSGSTAQSKSLNPVLGNFDKLDVKPYGVYLEEERKKLHEHWTRLAKEDLPSLYSVWRNMQSQRQCMWESMGKELLDKIDDVGEGTRVEEEKSPDHMLPHKQGDSAQDEDDVPQKEDEVGSSSGLSQDDKGSVGAEYSSGNEDGEESAPGILPDQGCDTATLHMDIIKNQEQSSPAGFLEGQDHDAAAFHTDIMKNHDEPVQGSSPDGKVASSTNQVSNIDGDSPVPGTSNDQPPGEIPPLNSSSQTYNLVDLEVANNPFNSKSVDTPLPMPAYSGNLNSSSIMGNQAVPLSSGGDAWQSVNMADSYYGSDHPPANKQEEREWADLESDLCEREAQKKLLHRQVNENSFKSFPDRGQNELLHSIFKVQDVMSYNHEQKGNQTNFQSTNVLMGNGRFPRQFDEQPRMSLPLDQELKIQNDLYMQQNVSGDLFPDGDRYSIQRQEHLFPVNVQDWGVNSACGSTPVSLPPPLPGGDLSSQNWFPHEHQARGGWTNSDGVGASSQSIGNSVNLDQSLYSVLSHCNQLHPGTSYDSIPHTEHFIPSRDYGLVGGGLGNVPNINNVLPHTAHSLEYLNRREPPGSLMNNDTGWMGLPNQNQNLNDPLGKPFLGSWNR